VRHRSDGGFTLVEVLVALVVVAIGLAALMVAVSGTARTSGYLRDKTLAQWIALNRLAEVRLTVNKLAQSSSTISTISTLGSSGGSSSGIGGTSSSGTSSSSSSGTSSGIGSGSSFSGASGDTGELQFANRTWHYDTRYFDTTFQSTKRIVVRVWAGDAKTKGNPLAEATGFFGTGLSVPGNSNALDWTQGNTAASANCQPPGTGITGAVNQPGTATANCTPAGTVATPPTVAPAVPTSGVIAQ
jgi:prepilin-type N-terminal cleavage/methylation domain-containing protein